MDTLTHALSGALLARATAPHPSPAVLPPGRRLLVGALAASFPDLDFVTSFVSPIFYIEHHRGLTHSLPLAPLWALAIAWLCAVAWRRDRAWRAYFGVTVMGIMLHILGDLITSYGTMALAPFSDARYAWDTTFIIDLWFTGILLAGLLISWLRRRSRVPAALGLVVVASYVGWQATQRHVAVAFGKGYAAGAGLETARVTAQPRPVSPLNWIVFVEDGERLDYALVRLAQGDAPAPLPTDAGFLAGSPPLPAAQPCHMGDDAALRRERGGREPRAHGMAAARVRVLPLVRRIPHRLPRGSGQSRKLRLVPGPALLHARAADDSLSLRAVPGGRRSMAHLPPGREQREVAGAVTARRVGRTATRIRLPVGYPVDRNPALAHPIPLTEDHFPCTNSEPLCSPYLSCCL